MSLGKKFTYTGIGLMAAAILFTVMVAGIDVRPIAPDGSLVGMGGLNIAFAEAFFSDVPGVYTINRVLYGISEFGGILAIVTAAAFGVLGVYQLIKRKKIFKQVHETFGGSLRLIISGGAGIDPQILQDMQDMGFPCIQGYGLTECAPILALNRDCDFNNRAAGLPLPDVDVQVIDKDENGIG